MRPAPDDRTIRQRFHAAPDRVPPARVILLPIDRLTLRLIAGTWYLDWAEHRDCGQVRRLFGTTLIATPHTFMAATGEVISAIQALNPEAVIRVQPQTDDREAA